MGLLDRFTRLLGDDALTQREERDSYPLSIPQWVMQYQGGIYPLGMNQTLKGNKEDIANNFAGLASGAMGMNGVVFACMQARMMLLSEVRFQFQAMRKGRPGDLYSTPALDRLETPWPTATTGDLIARADEDVSLAGNFFAVLMPGNRIKRLRPDWVTLVLTGENGDPDTEVLGILFQPGGPGSGRDPMTFLREQIVHFAPIPDPLASYRGMSWLTPIIREIQADSQATVHKESSFMNGATPNMIVKLDVNNMEKFEAMKKQFRDNHEGAANAFKTLFLAGGADATVVGQNFQQMDFKALQGSAETRIAAASGVHPVVVALSEGLQGSSLNSGNFTAAARLTGDKFLRWWWRGFAGSVENIVDVPGGSRLWYDARDVAFLQADITDRANVQQVEAQTIKALIDSGYEPDSIVKAVQGEDWSLLQHTHLFSVQLQPPMPDGPPKPEPAPLPAPAMNGSNGKRDDGATQLAFASIVAAAIERRAPDVIRIEPQIQVPTPEVHIDVAAAPTPNVEVHPPDVHVDVAAAVPTVDVHVPETQPATVDVHVPTPEVTVNVETPPRSRRVVRDEKDRITGIEEE